MSRLTSNFILIILVIACAKFLDAGTPMILAQMEREGTHLLGNNTCVEQGSCPVLPPPDGYLRKAVEPITLSSRPLLLHRFEITWYTNKQGWPPGNNITASGVKTEYGIVACPTIFPFRVHFTILMPWGTEDFICLDRFAGPGRWGLDVWLPSPAEGYKWHGERWVIVVFDNRPLEEYNVSIQGR